MRWTFQKAYLLVDKNSEMFYEINRQNNIEAFPVMTDHHFRYHYGDRKSLSFITWIRFLYPYNTLTYSGTC